MPATQPTAIPITEEAKTEQPMKCPVILAADGHNWIAFKSLVPIYFGNETDVWEVSNGELKEPKLNPGAAELTADQKLGKARFEKANKRARQLLFAAIDQKLIVTMFYNQTALISAPEIWTKLSTPILEQGKP